MFRKCQMNEEILKRMNSISKDIGDGKDVFESCNKKMLTLCESAGYILIQ